MLPLNNLMNVCVHCAPAVATFVCSVSVSFKVTYELTSGKLEWNLLIHVNLMAIVLPKSMLASLLDSSLLSKSVE